jgi:hypothetical protein
VSEWPEAKLTKVAPAGGPDLVRVSEQHYWEWLGTDGCVWTAEWEGDHDAWHVYVEDGTYGNEEEDYAVVGWYELLAVVAQGRG